MEANLALAERSLWVMNRVILILVFFLTLVSFNSQSQTVVYSGRYGYDAIAHVDDGVIYKGRSRYDAIAHIDGYISDMQLYAVLILILDM